MAQPAGSPTTARLVALFVAAALIFNFPLLAIALPRGAALWIFGAWAALIALVAWLVERTGPTE